MASEFTRKVQKIKDILKFNSVLADDGDVLLTKDGEVYTQVNGKVKQLSNPNYGKDNANKILSVSDTGDAVPIPMPNSGDILDKDNTFTGINTFKKLINGGLASNKATFTKFSDVSSNMFKYSGEWYVWGDNIEDSPLRKNWLQVSINSSENNAGIIRLTSYSDNRIAFGVVNGGHIDWHILIDDNTVLHNSGNETSSGDKTFNGQTTLLNGNFGLRVTNSGILKTTDAGNTWVAL